jgi:hypothetical protein
MVDTITQNAPYYVRQQHFDNDRMAGSVPVWKNNTSAQDVPASASTLSLANGTENTNITAPSLSFGELLDVVNPLHHLPIVGNVYRELTDDKISAVARISGGLLYGGPLGGAVSLANVAIEEHTGQDIAGAVTSGASSKTYSFEEEPRTAGLNKKQFETASVEPIEHNIKLTQLKSEEQKPISNTIFDKLNKDIKPVTEVVIAQNTAVRSRGFNA